MSAETFAHGTPAGWDHGCRGANCANHGTELDTCERARTRYAGDYGYRKRIDAGWTTEQIHEADVAEAIAVAEVERRARVAVREAARTLPAPKPVRVPKERALKEPREPKPVVERRPKEPEHGSMAGYRAGCFTAEMCSASPTCEEVNLARLGLLAERRSARPAPKSRPKQSELPAEHGTLTMHRRGCRGEDCPATPSCAEVAQEFYSTRNKSMVRNVQGHGTNASWARGCHCEECHEAHKQYYRDYWRTRRESVPVDQHGTAYGYSLGCRDRDLCPGADGVKCADASLAEERRRRRERGIPAKELVDAAPVIEHVKQLRDAKVPVLEIAKRAGVGKTAIATLLYGRFGPDRSGQIPTKVEASRAARILAVQR